MSDFRDTDNLYYSDIESIADLDVYHFGGIEKSSDEDDFGDLVSLDAPEDLDDLEQKIISAGLGSIEAELAAAARKPEQQDMPEEQETADAEEDTGGTDDETERDNGTDLAIDVSMCEEINFVIQLGGVILVRDISLKNEGDGEIRDIKVRIYSDEEIIFPCEEEAPPLLEGEEWHIVQPDIRVNTSYLAFLGERCECSIYFEVTGKDRFSNLVSRSVRKTLVVMAYDQWKGNDFYTHLLPAFIVPNQPFISELVTEAATILEEKTGSSVLDAYLTDDKSRVRQMAQAVYEAITRRRISEIPYTANSDDILRRIRLAEKIRKMGRASGYDITLIYMSCLEAIGLNPVMYLRPQEAYAGLWLTDKTFEEAVTRDEVEAAEKVDSGEIILIDCRTMLLGSECSFEESVKRAFDAVFVPEQFVAMLDVARARRNGVKSLPLRIHSDTGNGGKKRKKKKKREKAVIQPVMWNSLPAAPAGKIADTGSRAEALAARNIEKWKKRLYDPDGRNQLTDMRLNGKLIPLLSAFINDYVDMLSDVMYFGLVPCPAEMEMPDKVTLENCNQTESVRDVLRADFRRKKVHTAYDHDKTEKLAAKIMYEAEKALADYGKSTLYLAAGMLRWTEITSGDVKYAPLVFLPVEIRQGDDMGRPFRLTEAQPQFNHALLRKMERDYFLNVEGLFPLPRDYHGVDVKRVCELFKTAIEGREGWEVIETAFLGLFDLPGFFQRRMLEEAEGNRSHHILKGLSEGISRIEPDRSAVNQEQVYFPLSCDHYQKYVVRAAMQEMSFAISGAPGSGKTRTIADIIANCISRGKTVLFACEKTRAYRDVLKALEKTGLLTYCLYVQQGNVKLRDLLFQLRKALQSNEGAENTGYRALAYEFSGIGDALDGYTKTMNRRHVCGYSLRELLDIYENYRDYPDYPMQGIDADSITSVILQQRKSMVEELIAAGRSVGHPKDNPLSDVRKTVFAEDLRIESEKIAARGKEKLVRFRQSLKDFVTLLELDLPVSEEDIDQMISIAEFVSELRDIPSFLLLKNDAGPILKQLREYISGADTFAGKDIAMSGKWTQEFLHADMDVYMEEYRAAKSRLFFKERAMKEFCDRLSGYASFPFNARQIPGLLAEVKTYQEESELQAKRWEELPDEGRTLLKDYPTYEAADELTRRVDAYRQLCDQLPTLMRYAYNVDIRTEATELADALPPYWRDVREEWAALVGLLDIDTRGYIEDPVGRMDSICSALLENRDILLNWIRFNELAERIRSNDLGYLVDRYLEGTSHEDIMGIFQRGVYASLIRSILAKNPAAGQFDADAFNKLINHFRTINGNLTRLAPFEIREKMRQNKPRQQESPKIAVELMSLKRALSTFGRGMTVRNVFDMWPDLLVRLCPCIMMSPSACAEYMSKKWPQFDVVIMDEASTIPIERAAGVIAKGRELILSGDICQNPVRDSVLEMCLAAGLPEIRLGIHYRSRKEKLFTFSNRAFYNGSYLTFPAPDGENECLDYIYVPKAQFDGKRQVNEAEAAEAVRAVLDIYEQNRDQKCSLGIIAFGHSQQMYIGDLLEDEYAANPSFAEWVRMSGEDILVTDAVGAQGYERDYIILSVTMTAPDVPRECAHMIDENGWKYLNTCITRARFHMTVITSVTAQEIREKYPAGRGAASLADYLEYASGVRRNAGESLSIRRQRKAGVLKSVRKTLDDAGYITRAMVGDSDFRVDIAVSLPDDPDRAILGILLDSENYSGIESADDRDILISSELVDRGWPVMNIWCMEWWTKRDEVKKRMLSAVDYLKSML